MSDIDSGALALLESMSDPKAVQFSGLAFVRTGTGAAEHACNMNPDLFKSQLESRSSNL